MRKNGFRFFALLLALALGGALQAQDPTSRHIELFGICTALPPLTTQTVQLELWDAAVSGTMVHTETHTVDVDATGCIVDTGTSSVLLGRPGGGLNPALFPAGPPVVSRYLDVTQPPPVGTLLTARIPLYAAPFTVAPGPQGPQGPAGPTGPAGPQGPAGPPGVVQTVTAADPSVVVGGTPANRTVAVANSGITTPKLALNAVTGANIVSGAVVRSLNGMTEGVTLAAGSNITVTPSAGTLTIAAPNALTTVAHNATLSGSGTVGSPLIVAVPLSLGAISSGAIITASNSGNGAGVSGSGAIGVVGTGNDRGVQGLSNTGPGVLGISTSGTGVAGTGNDQGVQGFSNAGFGVTGISNNRTGVMGQGGPIGVTGTAINLDGTGVLGNGNISTTGGTGVSGVGFKGVVGTSPTPQGFGVIGAAHNAAGAIGVFGNSMNGVGVNGLSTNNIGVFGVSLSGGLAGLFSGRVEVSGYLAKLGGGFRIDHPLDPANLYLIHSFVESPDMMNIYNGVTKLDEDGEAVVELPTYFEALNKDFRYQLTAIGMPAPNLYIAEEVAGNRFKIAGGRAGMKVSWQVTGIRQDAWANANRPAIEPKKPELERGFYLTPAMFGEPEEKGIEWARNPELMKRLKEEATKSRELVRDANIAPPVETKP